MKFDVKELGLTALLGTAVVVGTPYLYGFLAGFTPIASIVKFSLIPGVIDLGTLVSATAVAYVANLAINQWLK